MPTGAFYVRVHALAGGERSSASNEIRIFVNTPSLPSPPAGLLGLANGTALDLTWRNTFDGGAPTGLLLDVSGGFNGSLPLGLAERFHFDGVPPGTYTFRVRATNAAGASDASGPVTLMFPVACSGPPLPPTQFLAYRVSHTIVAMWAPPSTGAAPTAYSIEVGGRLTATVSTPDRAVSGAVPAGDYTLRVASTNACGTSAPTAVQAIVVP